MKLAEFATRTKALDATHRFGDLTVAEQTLWAARLLNCYLDPRAISFHLKEANGATLLLAYDTVYERNLPLLERVVELIGEGRLYRPIFGLSYEIGAFGFESEPRKAGQTGNGFLVCKSQALRQISAEDQILRAASRFKLTQ